MWILMEKRGAQLSSSKIKRYEDASKLFSEKKKELEECGYQVSNENTKSFVARRGEDEIKVYLNNIPEFNLSFATAANFYHYRDTYYYMVVQDNELGLKNVYLYNSERPEKIQSISSVSAGLSDETAIAISVIYAEESIKAFDI